MLFCQINQPQQNLLSLIAQLPVKKQLTLTVPKVFQNTLQALHAHGEKRESHVTLQGARSVAPTCLLQDALMTGRRSGGLQPPRMHAGSILAFCSRFCCVFKQVWNITTKTC